MNHVSAEQRLYRAVVSQALLDAYLEEKGGYGYMRGPGATKFAAWVRSRDGREVLDRAGLDLRSAEIDRCEKKIREAAFMSRNARKGGSIRHWFYDLVGPQAVGGAHG
ncbi:hypothetical protein CDV50_04945 [Haematobacter massiliensis]|uniref:DUF6280 family protein n=1 Tax=Haematobacter massiliensis TaxID=195105 RepID=UPI000B49813F|nr:DUF6280 family protein [Haematobacter massiliensis]OWJ72522.1 hypothetical protein CDV50_04945 [Haematobacter massiliensis]